MEEKEFVKVGVAPNGAMHLVESYREQITLCGREWHYENSHGATYCQTCQYIYANRERLLTKRAPDSRYVRAKKARLAKEKKLYALLGLQ